MNYFAIGFRRTRNDRVMDVVYTTIQKENDSFQQFYNQLSNATLDAPVALTDLDYQACRDTLFPELPAMPINSGDSYANVDAILFILSSLDAAISCTEDAYFRLQLLSQRVIKPHEQSLDGIFGHLPNIAWTTIGPMLPEDVETQRLTRVLNNQSLVVTHVDKFPYMVNYHIPSGVRIADGSRVRLGAYLAEGTTVMPAGFVNFNAGSLGSAMIEGRVSAGVVIGDSTDIGGGASIMGTLSGGNDRVISVGKECLLGANAGIGISLGDGCTVAAGVYVYAGKKVRLVNEHHEPIDIHSNRVDNGANIVKASDLSGISYKLFMEDSLSGELICKPNAKTIHLNQALHAND